MSSPVKTKDKKKEPSESKKRQLLNVFHQSISFLQILTPEELDTLEDKLHVFVFSRGQVLAREIEPIDYVGVIAEGRAISKSRHYQIGDLIGHSQVLGFHQKHPQTITGESDGVIIAIRIYDLSSLSKPSLSNKITSHLSEIYTNELLKREQIKTLTNQFQSVQQRKIAKYLTPEWSLFLSELDIKQKSKFTNYFPFYSAKQKDMVLSTGTKGYLLYVIRGQLIAKSKQQSKIIEAGQIYQPETFLLNEQSENNVYCLSTDADILLVSRTVLQNNFKTETFKSLLKIALNSLNKMYQSEDIHAIQDKKDEKKANQWSIFKKYPDRQILPLPKKSTNTKPQKPTNLTQQLNLMAFQTLFREQLGPVDGKVKTNTSVAESNYEKLYSLKTEPHDKESYIEGEAQKLRKEVQILAEKLKFAEEMGKISKLDLIENKSRLSMNKVLKEIQKLHIEEDVVHPMMKSNEGQGSLGLLTFKQAFDKQVKQNKIQSIVAKCAFKWLYLTRRRKALSKKL